MRTLLVCLLLATAALAGCASDEPAPEQSEASDLDFDEGVDEQPEQPAAQEDEPEATAVEPANETQAPGDELPTLEFTADVLEGTVPLTVVFNLTGQDPEGAELRWTLDVQSDDSPDEFGGELPAVVEVVYDQVGNYTATATLSAGNHTVSQHLNITVEEVPEAPRETTTYSCTTTVGAMFFSLSTGTVNVGGCNVASTSDEQEVMESNPAEFCTIQADLDGDGFADEDATVGKVYPGGVSFTAFCEPPAVNAESSLVLSPP